MEGTTDARQVATSSQSQADVKVWKEIQHYTTMRRSRTIVSLPSWFFFTAGTRKLVSHAFQQCRVAVPNSSGNAPRMFHTQLGVGPHETLVQDMIFRIRAVNSVPNEIQSNLLDFVVDGIQLGKVTPGIAQTLVTVFPDAPVFEVKTTDNGSLSSPLSPAVTTYLTLSNESGKTCESRTEAVQRVMMELRSRNIVTGWRDEMYPISHGFYKDPVFLMERAAVPLLGAMEYGVHINGLVRDTDGTESMWMARRSAQKSKYPGMLDHIVAGGQPYGLGLLENVIKECQEEAGIPSEIALAGVRPAGAISYMTYSASSDRISRAVLFAYDLWLPPSFEPKPVDGEVDSFFLWTIDEVQQSMAKDYHDPIKPNCYPIIIDYLLRAGHVSPEAPGYLDVLRELRSGDCY